MVIKISASRIGIYATIPAAVARLVPRTPAQGYSDGIWVRTFGDLVTVKCRSAHIDDRVIIVIKADISNIAVAGCIIIITQRNIAWRWWRGCNGNA